MASGQVARVDAAPVEGSLKQIAERSALDQERRFYAVAAFAMLAITVIGFRQFILHGRATGGVPITPQILGLVIMHGLAMLGWVILLCIQSTLIVTKRTRFHIALGRTGALLAGMIVLFGLAVAPLSVHFNPAEYADFGGGRYFLALMLPEPLTFGALAAVAFVYRFRREIHRPMILLATLVLMTGPLTRWPYWDEVVRAVNGNIAVAMFGEMLVLGAVLFVIHAAVTRRASAYFAAGYACVAVVSIWSSLIARSAAWDQIARLVVP